MTVVTLTDEQANEVLCDVLAQIIKNELDKKKLTGIYNRKLTKASMEVIEHFLTTEENEQFVDLVNTYAEN